MPKLVEWCSEASTVHWEQESRQLPDAERAVRRMLEDGRLTGVRPPSEAQDAGEIPPVERPRGEIPLSPVRD